ncbi:unnamed protein product [Urochloa decumbens]|uniref:Uncharacterized protein n=1 Tax=Urochloa decumbens TaxID=240449 RepID=A0ABC9B1V8_9POAL
MNPNDMPLSFLEYITNHFSDNQRLGSGGYGDVYKGVDRNGKEIAVKKLYQMQGLGDQQFKNEFSNLRRVQHQNIVRLVGYCAEERLRYENINGEYIYGKMIYRILCFEYLQLGSLDKHLSEESHGPDWLTRYKIIKGICEGLNFLHGGLENPIFHLDLKPANILLDKNMVPKISDFGLSRLFRGTCRTQATESFKGTEYYMPPEYITMRLISNKYDIFSLGIIIIQIMTGPMGYLKYANTPSPLEFIKLVHKNWMERIKATSKYAEQECQQVKRCIEIALNCVEAKKDKRPTIGDIICELRKTETSRTKSSWVQANVSKIGPWGGTGGGLFDVGVAPHRLETLIIGSGEVIYSLKFLYSDYKGQQHSAGPWGGYGPRKASYHDTIQLGLSEYVTEISGTIGPFYLANSGVITSLTFITNVGSYGPFGTVGGISFQIPVQSHGGIAGLFAYAGWYIDAIGIYVNPVLKTVNEEEKEDPLAKIGPWGGNGGRPWDINMVPSRLQSMTIRSSSVVNSLEFSYLDSDGQKHTAGPWGGPNGSAYTIHFGASEFLTGVYGTAGRFTDVPEDVITSLTLFSNTRSYGPFGHGGGTSFQMSKHSNGSIVGFFGRAESYLDAIGIYTSSELEAKIERKAGLTKVGPWGGIGGMSHDIDNGPEPHRLESIKIYCDAVVNSIGFSYTEYNQKEHSVGPWGAPGGKLNEIHLQPLEILQGISGTYGPFGTSRNVITSLTFATNHGRAYGPYGKGGGTAFNLLVGREQPSCIVGFFGRAESYLESIGLYLHTY